MLASQNDYVLSELQNLSLFSNFKTDQIKELIQGSFIKLLRHREILFLAGDKADCFYVVLGGAFKLIRPTPRGDEIIVYFATKSDVLGALVLVQGASHFPVTAKSIGQSRVLCIPRNTFEALWSTNHALLSQINSMLYKRMNFVQGDKSLLRSSLSMRITALLSHLIDKAPSESDVIDIPITRQEIADSLGATVESVIRIMSEWTKDGIIRSVDGKIEILSMENFLNIE